MQHQQNLSLNRAGRKARDWYNDRTREGMQRLFHALYGPNATEQGINRPEAGSLLGRLGALGTQARGEHASILGNYDQSTRDLLERIAGGTQSLDALGAGAEGMARQWGVGRRAQIKEDAAEDLANLHGSVDAALAAGGFNSPTERAAARRASTRTVGRNRDRALQDLADAQIDRTMGARTQRIGTLANRTQFGDTAAINRSSARTSLLTDFLNQQLSLDRAPIDVELAAISSSIANPWLGQNTVPFYPGASGAAGLGQGAANAVGAYSGYAAAQQGRRESQQDYATMLRELEDYERRNSYQGNSGMTVEP